MAYLVQAKNAGCTLHTEVHTPEDLPFEETDLCVILGNALENAIHACEAQPEELRNIQFSLELTENQRLMFSVRNPCPQPGCFSACGRTAFLSCGRY